LVDLAFILSFNKLALILIGSCGLALAQLQLTELISKTKSSSPGLPLAIHRFICNENFQHKLSTIYTL